jgi:putative endopeptidase
MTVFIRSVHMFKNPAIYSHYLLLYLLSTLLLLANPQTTVAEVPKVIEAGVDVSVNAGDDFFAYANGDWLKSTNIPAGKERWSERHQIAELSRQQLVNLLEASAAAPAGSLTRKVADYRAAYLNQAAIEAIGLKPVKPHIEKILRLHDKRALIKHLGKIMHADVDPLQAGIYQSANILGFAVQASTHGEKTYSIFLLQGGLGLPDREHYLNLESNMQTLRLQYVQYIARLLVIAGVSRDASAFISTERAKAVLALETAIAETHATRAASSEDSNADNIWSRADFKRHAPGIDWALFFAAAGLNKNEKFVAWQPSAIKGAAQLMASQPLQVWKDYLAFHVIHARADVLPQRIADDALAIRAAATGQTPVTTRRERAIDATQSAMSPAIGQLYVERYFPPAYKARVETIANNVVAAFARRVDALTWMSPDTKTLALAKLKNVYFGVGYPNKWQNYADLNVIADDALGNLERIAQRNTRRARAKLGQPIDNTEWLIAPQRPGAVLSFHQNAYNFAAALLQVPKFDPVATQAANYGAIGAIVGHEVSHFIDTLGAEYAADGSMRRWWTPHDINQYQAATQALVKQYASYQPLVDASINAKHTLIENVADLGGLAAAFDAYRHTLGSLANDKDYVRQQDRQFFIGFARSWRSKMSEVGLRKYLAADSHAPERHRIATVRNIDAWYDAFDVTPTHQLYLAPSDRVRIW